MDERRRRARADLLDAAPPGLELGEAGEDALEEVNVFGAQHRIAEMRGDRIARRFEKNPVAVGSGVGQRGRYAGLRCRGVEQAEPARDLLTVRGEQLGVLRTGGLLQERPGRLVV